MELIVHRIKPLLDQIGRAPTPEAIAELHAELERADGTVLQYFSDVVLVGILNILRGSSVRPEHKTHLVGCMSAVIAKIRLLKPVQYETLLKSMVHEIYDAEAASLRTSASEEQKIAVLECMAWSARRLSVEVVEQFYVRPKVALLAQAFFVCVEVILKERFRKLRLAAVNCILALMQIHDDVEYDPVLRHQIAGVLFVILPKTLAALVAIIHGDDKQGQALMATGVKALGRVVCLVMQDFGEYELDRPIAVADFRAVFDASRLSGPKDAEILGMSAKDSDRRREFFNSVERSDDWLQAAARKMAPTLKNLSKLRGSGSEAVRKELVVASALLVDHCSKNLRHSLPDLLENLIALSQDAEQKTAKEAQQALHKFITAQKYLDVWSELETLFYQHLLTIPRLMYQCEERAQLAALALLHGYLNFLSDERLAVVVGQPHILEYLVKALIACAELDLPADLLENEFSVLGLEEPVERRQFGWKVYKNLKTDSVELEFRRVCRAIAQSVAFDRIVGYILDHWLDNAGACNEFVALLTEICLGITEGEVQRHSVATILDELANDVHWDLATQPNQRIGIEKDEFGDSQWTEDRIEGVYESATEIRIQDLHYRAEDEEGDDVVTVHEAKYNVQHECLALEMVGNGALALGAQHFERFLFRFLHRILEKMGCRNRNIHNAGNYALQAVAKGLACDSAAELIHQNSNFFIYFINRSMKANQYNSSGLDILSIVLQHSTLESLPYLENMVRSVLDELALHQRNDVTASLNIFSVFIASLNQWRAAEVATNPKNMIEEAGNTIDKWLSTLNRQNDPPTAFFDANEMSKTAQELYKEDLERTPVENEATEEAEELENTPPPKYVELVRDVVRCCLKYMPSANVSEQAMAVETVNHSLRILEPFENDLLPIVHEVWYPLTERFKERNPIVVIRCFDLLLTMGRCAKDFILLRTIKDVVPHINRFLKDTAADSAKKTKDRSYHFSQQCKLQLKILGGYANLLVDLEVKERELDQILDIVTLYLQPQQPQCLQDAAKAFRSTIFEYDPTTVTLKLMAAER